MHQLTWRQYFIKSKNVIIWIHFKQLVKLFKISSYNYVFDLSLFNSISWSTNSFSGQHAWSDPLGLLQWLSYHSVWIFTLEIQASLPYVQLWKVYYLEMCSIITSVRYSKGGMCKRNFVCYEDNMWLSERKPA